MLIHYIPVYLRFMALLGNKKGGEEGGGGEKKYFHFIAQQNKNYLPDDARQACLAGSWRSVTSSVPLQASETIVREDPSPRLSGGDGLE